MTFPVSPMPIGPRVRGGRPFFMLRMSDGSVRLFGSAASAIRYLAARPAPALRDQLAASLRRAA